MKRECPLPSGRKRTGRGLTAAVGAGAVLLLAGALLLTGALSGIRFPGGESGVSSAGGEDAPLPAVVAGDEYPLPAPEIAALDTGGVALSARASGQYFYVRRDGEWACRYVKGVNMGLTLPTTDLDDPDIPYGTYLDWFEQIAAMNANTVRVFTLMNPDFYRAFADYNAAHADGPLYLIQGVWFDETLMESVGDAFGQDGVILKQFVKALREAADIVHGSSRDTAYGSVNPAIYDRDVSAYVLGYVLGLEWLPAFVKRTNTAHAGMAQYAGRYLTTENAAPFEIFLAQAGDALISYETETYRAQTPAAFLNWATTDVLTHENEPFPEEDEVSVNTETIRPTEAYYAGLFAAVDAYPYYPEFMNYEPEYLAMTDSAGKANPYRAYLRDLRTRYSVPVLVAEFGVSTARGVAHTGVMGYNQGGMTEREQGEALAAMSRDIAREGYAGGLVFSWQDEWFKQTWNTVKYAPASAAARGLNIQSAEQRFGLLAMEPGGADDGFADGDLSEWTGRAAVASGGGAAVYARTDAGYLHLMIRTVDGGRWDDTARVVGISLAGRGSRRSAESAVSFSRPVDFLLTMDGQGGLRLLADASEDLFYYQYGVRKSLISRVTAFERPDSGVFSPIRQFFSNELVLPLTGKTIPARWNETGLLRRGNANPASSAYDSLADYAVSSDGTAVEVRLPWYLLNVMNAQEHTVLGDFYADTGRGDAAFETAAGLWLGTARSGKDAVMTLSAAVWPREERAAWHSRAKQSVAVLQSAWADLMKACS